MRQAWPPVATRWSRWGRPLVAVLLLGVLGACQTFPAGPGRPASWPAHDGLRCVEVPEAKCQEMADQAELEGMAGPAPIRGLTVYCTRQEGCSEAVGAGETAVHHDDGSQSSFGWGYGSADGPPPAPPPGLGQPRPDVEVECTRLPQAVCDGRVDDVLLFLEPGAVEPVAIHVACAAGIVCTEEAAEGSTTVSYADGRVETSQWSMQGAAAPPGAP